MSAAGVRRAAAPALVPGAQLPSWMTAMAAPLAAKERLTWSSYTMLPAARRLALLPLVNAAVAEGPESRVSGPRVD